MPSKHSTFSELAISKRSVEILRDNGYSCLVDLDGLFFSDLYNLIPYANAKIVLKECISAGVNIHVKGPNLDESDWCDFVTSLVSSDIVTWKEIGISICGSLNPPQVGTAIASNKSFQKNFPPRKIMQSVIKWLYEQDGHCRSCGTRLSLEADHVLSKQDFLENGFDSSEADKLENLQLLCKRCNVIKRPSHSLGGLSFAPAQSVLIWVILSEQPKTREQFYKICREYGLTMANVRFDEAWAFAEWLHREGKYEIERSELE